MSLKRLCARGGETLHSEHQTIYKTVGESKSVKFLIFLIFLHSFLVYLEKTYSVFVKALRRVVEDALQRPLDNTARSQDALAQLHKSLPDLQRRRTACVNNGTLSGASSYWTSSECLCCGEKKKKNANVPLIQIFRFCRG